MYRTTTIAYRVAEAFYRNRRLFVVSFLLVSVVTMTALYLRSKTYMATALTQVITASVAQELGQQSSNEWLSPAQKNVNRLNVLLNGDFLSTALSNVHLQDPINTDPQANDPKMALLRTRLNPYVESDNLFAISLTWSNPADAAEIVRAVQQQYIQEVGEERYAQTNATLAFLNNQIAEYNARLQRAERVLTEYKQGNSGELPDAQDADVSQLSALQARLSDMQINASDAAKRKAALAQRLAQIKPLSIAAQTASSSPLQMEINQLKAQRDVMLVTMLPTHPLVLALTAKIKGLENQMQSKILSGSPEAQQVLKTTLEDNPEWQNLHDELVNANIDQQTQAAQMQHLQQEITQYTAIVQKIPAEQRTLTDVTRDYTIIQAQYDTLVQRREQVQMEGNLARVSASSSLSPIGFIHAEPTTGKKKMILMFVGSLLLGLVVGATLVVLCEWNDHSLRYGHDAENYLGVPVLAVVPDAIQLKVIKMDDTARGGRVRKRLPEPKRSLPSKAGAPALDGPAAPAMNASAVEGA